MGHQRPGWDSLYPVVVGNPQGSFDSLVVLIPLTYREDGPFPLGRRGEAPLEQGCGIPIIPEGPYPGGKGFEALP